MMAEMLMGSNYRIGLEYHGNAYVVNMGHAYIFTNAHIPIPHTNRRRRTSLDMTYLSPPTDFYPRQRGRLQLWLENIFTSESICMSWKHAFHVG